MNDQHRGANPYGNLSSRTSAGGRSKGPIVIGVVVLVVVVLGLVAFLLTSGGDDGGSTAAEGTGAAAAREATQETATVTIGGEDLPEYPASAGSARLVDPSTDEAVGRTIPSLSGESFDGSPVEIDPSDGRPKVILFVAHWCPHCQVEVPKVQEWIDEGNQPDGVDIYAVSTSVQSNQANYPPSNWLAREGWEPPVLLDDTTGTAATSYALPGFPYFLFVDGDGKVVQRGSGELPVEDFDAAVRQLAGTSAG